MIFYDNYKPDKILEGSNYINLRDLGILLCYDIKKWISEIPEPFGKIENLLLQELVPNKFFNYKSSINLDKLLLVLKNYLEFTNNRSLYFGNSAVHYFYSCGYTAGNIPYIAFLSGGNECEPCLNNSTLFFIYPNKDREIRTYIPIRGNRVMLPNQRPLFKLELSYIESCETYLSDFIIWSNSCELEILKQFYPDILSSIPLDLKNWKGGFLKQILELINDTYGLENIINEISIDYPAGLSEFEKAFK